MTVATNVSRADFTITTGTTEYPFTFRIFEDTDLVVILRATDGTVSTLVLNTDYTVDGVGDYNGGKVIVSSQFASDNDGAQLVVRRVLDLVQETSIRNQGKFYPETHENVFDRLTMIDQQQQEQINRSLKYPPAGSSGMSTDLPAPDPGKGLKWNATGDGLENTQHDADAIANIAAQYASQAAQSANDAAESAQDASDTYDDFRGTYYGPLSSDPSTDPLGNPPNQGDMYFNTTTNRLRVYSASGAWIEGAGGSMQTFPLTGDGIETTFLLPATPPNTDYADVYIDGVYQQKDTYSFVGGAIVFNDPPPAPANPGDHNIEVRVIEVLPLGVTDATLVTYTPAGSGTQTTVHAALNQLNSDVVLINTNIQMLSDRFGGTVSLQEFGAAGDGVTDDTAAIQAAIDSGAPDITGNGATFKVTASLVLRSDMRLRDAVLDFSSATTSTRCLTAAGTYEALKTINIELKGSTQLRLLPANVADLNAGDWIRVRAADKFDASSTNTQVGEINVIREVDYGTGTITTLSPLQTTYSVVPRQVQRIVPVRNIEIVNVTIRGANTDMNGMSGVWITCGTRIRIANCRFIRLDDRGVGFQDCTNSFVSGCTFDRARPASTGYGVSFIDCTQDCQASGNFFYDVRHALSTNNTSDPGGIVRRILFYGNQVFCSTYALSGSMGGGDAIDTHTAAEDITIAYNTVNGSTGQGINVECRTATVIGNMVRNTESNGITYHNESDFAGHIVMKGNHVESPNGIGIWVYQGTRGTSTVTWGGVIADNVVISSGSDGIRVNTPSTSSRNAGLSITGNSIYNAGAMGMRCEGMRACAVSNNTVYSSSTNGIRLIDCIGVTVSGNSVEVNSSSTDIPIYVQATGSGESTRVAITGNYASVASGSLGVSGILLDNNTTNSLVVGNNVRGTSGVTIGSGSGNIQANNVS